jgi:hypothetical protein
LWAPLFAVPWAMPSYSWFYIRPVDSEAELGTRDAAELFAGDHESEDRNPLPVRT